MVTFSSSQNHFRKQAALIISVTFDLGSRTPNWITMLRCSLGYSQEETISPTIPISALKGEPLLLLYLQQKTNDCKVLTAPVSLV